MGGLMQKLFSSTVAYQSKLLHLAGITGITPKMKEQFFMLSIKTKAAGQGH